jgi:hypothetical protein
MASCRRLSAIFAFAPCASSRSMASASPATAARSSGVAPGATSIRRHRALGDAFRVRRVRVRAAVEQGLDRVEVRDGAVLLGRVRALRVEAQVACVHGEVQRAVVTSYAASMSFFASV